MVWTLALAGITVTKLDLLYAAVVLDLAATLIFLSAAGLLRRLAKRVEGEVRGG